MTSIAQFFSPVELKNTVNVEGVLSGLTISRIDSEKTAVLNSLNQQITDFQNEQTATQQSRDALSSALTQAQIDTTNAIAGVQQEIDDNKNDIEGKLATETNARLSLETSVNNRTNYVDSELTRLQTQHDTDDTRLTTIEGELKTRDNDIDQKIADAVVLEQQRFDNQEPRLQLIESKLIIDEVNKTITIPADYTLVVSGSLTQGQ